MASFSRSIFIDRPAPSRAHKYFGKLNYSVNCKSRFSITIQEKAEPFGDRSKDLWNTLSIWLSALEDGELEAGKARFLMVTNKTLPDCIAKQLSNAKTSDEIDDCIKALNAAAANPSETIREFTKKVLAAPSEKHLRELILNCELIDETSGASGVQLRESTIAELQIPSDFTKDAQSIVDELLGWVRGQVLASWQKRTPAWIARDSFVTQFHAALGRRKRQKGRERAARVKV